MKRKAFYSLSVLSVFMVGVYTLFHWLSNFEEENKYTPFDDISSTNPSGENFLVLWRHRWDRKDDWPPEGHAFGRCTITYDRRKIPSAKAIIFHFTSLYFIDFPWKIPRYEDQLYVWWNSESPPSLYKEIKYSNFPFEKYDKGFFNWTMSYKLESDVWWGYGHCNTGNIFYSYGKHVIENIIAQKKKTALWITSNCDRTKSALSRMKYIKKVAEYIPVTMKGGCFNEYVTDKEIIELGKTHKFYFAFENSYHCRDYITEKFWVNALKHDLVPIVFGPLKFDLLKVAPPHSFIYAEDFGSPKKLADYLLRLDRNEEEYKEYFRWRENATETREKCSANIKKYHHDLTFGDPGTMLCEKILKNKNSKTVKSLTDFISHDEPKECFTG